MIVDRSFLPDLRKLKNQRGLLGLSRETKEHFTNIGIMTMEVKADSKYKRTWVSSEPQSKVEYKMNENGKMLAKYGFGAEDTARV